MKHNDGGYSPDCPCCQTLPHPARHDDTVWALPAKEPARSYLPTIAERQADSIDRIADTLGRIQGILRDILVEISGQNK